MNLCPMCGGNATGKVGLDQYYCWDCMVEYNSRNEVFQIGEEGELIAMEDQSQQTI